MCVPAAAKMCVPAAAPPQIFGPVQSILKYHSTEEVCTEGGGLAGLFVAQLACFGAQLACFGPQLACFGAQLACFGAQLACVWGWHVSGLSWLASGPGLLPAESPQASAIPLRPSCTHC